MADPEAPASRDDDTSRSGDASEGSPSEGPPSEGPPSEGPLVTAPAEGPPSIPIEPSLKRDKPKRPPLVYDVGAFTRALIALLAVGASVGGFCYELTLGEALLGLVDSNKLEGRRALAYAVVGGGGGLVFAALGYFAVALFKRDAQQRVERLHRLALFLLPGSLMIFIPFLFNVQSWSKDREGLLIFMGTLALVLERMLRSSIEHTPAFLSRVGAALSRRQPSWLRYAPFAVVVLGAVGYSLYCSYYTILHHRRFATACFDLGQYDNLFFNAMVGHPFKIPSLSGEEDWASLKGHAELGMYALLPLYMLKPGPETLLIIQSTLLGTAAIPLYLFGTRFIPRWMSMSVALSYLLYAPLHRSNFYDFHMQPMAAVFILWMLYFLVARRRVLFWIFFLLALTMREDISIGLTVLGVFLIVTGYRPKLGMTIALVSVSYFIVLKFVVMPRFGKWWFANIYKELQIGDRKGYGSIVETLLTNPAYVFKTLLNENKLAYALHILVPLAFLPLRRLYLALAIVPGFFFTLLTTGYNPTISIGFQYNTYYVPYVFPACIVALRVLGGDSAQPERDALVAQPAGSIGAPGVIAAEPDGPRGFIAEGYARRAAAMLTMIAMTLVSSYQFGAILQRETFRAGFSSVAFQMSDDERQRYADLHDVVQHIPPGASVAATEHLAPHVSTRSSLYCFRSSIGNADWIVIGPIDKTSKVRTTVQKLLQDGKAGVVAQTGEFFVLRLGADTSRNDEALDQLRMSGAGPGTKTAPRPTVPKITPDVSALPDPGRSPPAAPSDEPDERPTP